METINELSKCEICPHKCKINRNIGQIGRCKSKQTVKIAKISIHEYEEPCISGENGSGTIFFSNCNLNCVFCQNYEISQEGKGKEFTVEQLADIFLAQQSKNVENINLVTPTSYVPQIIEAIKMARLKGLNIPIVYNTNGYENVETIKKLNGYIDIYLPDLKYYYNELGEKYSKVKKYFEISSMTIKEMYNQVKGFEFDERGIMKKGMIIRHLILPGQVENSKKVLKWIEGNFSNEIMVSVMAQYFPTYKAKNIEEINRKINQEEYNDVQNYLFSLNLENGYIQELGEHEEEYVPNWDIT